MGQVPIDAVAKLREIFRVFIGDYVEEWETQKRQSEFCIKTDLEWVAHLLSVHKRCCTAGDGCNLPHAHADSTDFSTQSESQDVPWENSMFVNREEAANLQAPVPVSLPIPSKIASTKPAPAAIKASTSGFNQRLHSSRRMPYAVNRPTQRRRGNYGTGFKSSYVSHRNRSHPVTKASSTIVSAPNDVPTSVHEKLELTLESNNEVIVIKEEPDFEYEEADADDIYDDASTSYPQQTVDSYDDSTETYDDSGGVASYEGAEEGAGASTSRSVKREAVDDKDEEELTQAEQQSMNWDNSQDHNKMILPAINPERLRHTDIHTSTQQNYFTASASYTYNYYGNINKQFFDDEISENVDTNAGSISDASMAYGTDFLNPRNSVVAGSSINSPLRGAPMHIDLESSETTCIVCAVILPTGEINEHLLRHRLFMCQYCGKVHKQRANLNKHTRIHTGVKPFVCQFCQKAFSDPSNYAKHISGICKFYVPPPN